MNDLFQKVSEHGVLALLGMIVGAFVGWIVGIRRRHRERLSILRGDARDTIVIQHHLITAVDVPVSDGGGTRKAPATLRIRALGQSELSRVVPNGHLASELSRRAFRVTPQNTLISMDGAEGSYLLETLNNFVCDRVANAPFEHDLFVMAPCCEPAELSTHQPITILLIAVQNLSMFEEWALCRNVQVEHGSDGMRVLTLMDLAGRFRKEQAHLADLRKAGKRTRYVETMYVLDLGLDKRSANVPVKNVPWGRFEDVLKQMNLE
jgi:hypothetical protein